MPYAETSPETMQVSRLPWLLHAWASILLRSHYVEW